MITINSKTINLNGSTTLTDAKMDVSVSINTDITNNTTSVSFYGSSETLDLNGTWSNGNFESYTVSRGVITDEDLHRLSDDIEVVLKENDFTEKEVTPEQKGE